LQHKAELRNRCVHLEHVLARIELYHQVFEQQPEEVTAAQSQLPRQVSPVLVPSTAPTVQPQIVPSREVTTSPVQEPISSILVPISPATPPVDCTLSHQQAFSTTFSFTQTNSPYPPRRRNSG
jgi:hypothetical protein